MANKPEPITPNEVLRKRNGRIPPVVFEVFNEFIINTLVGSSATVYQDEVVQVLTYRGLNRAEIFAKHWLDVEDEFRKAGWNVTYEKPSYNESGRAYYIFSMDKS